MSQTPGSLNYSTGPQKPPAGLAVSSLVLGIVSVVLFCVWQLAIPCAILAIVFGVIGGNRAKAGTGSGEGMAKAGFICGCVALALDILLVIAVLIFGVTMLKHAQTAQQQILQQQRQAQQQIQQQQQQQLNPPPAPAVPAAPNAPDAPSSGQ